MDWQIQGCQKGLRVIRGTVIHNDRLKLFSGQRLRGQGLQAALEFRSSIESGDDNRNGKPSRFGAAHLICLLDLGWNMDSSLAGSRPDLRHYSRWSLMVPV